ncbi:toprim domain-containing protein [Alicyclobacillus dauci]|uniref:Toprim domain-containing protein n=1 Tax=Alicyclobacillus dauci TaxID=1475485 RepID=A0ABY6Z257_9BACL|nr:toprim domain-containing protein [Alicyclobacillus dauci]WAH36688.1 toprim domain-containing protein [Alicyclobacillus dauci]
MHTRSTSRKVIIVEGKTDKARILRVLREEVEVVCTKGTLSYEQVENEIVPLQQDEVYILVDADAAGNRLRKQLKHELPNARDLYTRKSYAEVARTPLEYLAKILSDAHFEIDDRLLTVGVRSPKHTAHSY